MAIRAQPLTTAARARAWMVHAYTASGAVLALAMTIAVVDGRFRRAFVLMIVATAIDGSDGILARRARVKQLAPELDGARLDDIVDYLTFVFVPALLLIQADLLPDRLDLVVAAGVLLSSAYGFSAVDAKTNDDFFTGFPSYWNIVALYLYVGHLPAAANAGILMALSALVFVRIGYVYPTRTRVLRGLTIALCLIWALMIVGIVIMLPNPPVPLIAASLAFPIYYVVLSFVLNARRAPRQ